MCYVTIPRPPKGVCPSCGKCRDCGHQPTPYSRPTYPWGPPYSAPWWGVNTVQVTC